MTPGTFSQKAFLALSLFAGLIACNNSPEAAKDAPKTDTVAATAAAPAPAPFLPFTLAVMTHSVKDYAKWRPVFDADSAARKEHGMETIVVAHAAGKPNDILMAFRIADVQKAKDFGASPALKEKMAMGGVVSKPMMDFYTMTRFDTTSKEKQWVEVRHKVKDYDTWLKAFDGEGTAARASQGLIDVVLARGVDDPNVVFLVFDVKDMAKAKASMMSADKKKLMESAGVIGKPDISFYQEIQ